MTTATTPGHDPAPILQTAFAFWSSKGGISYFFDALVAMQYLDREGNCR